MNVTDYFEKGKNVKQEEIERDIQKIGPQMIIMVICFGRTLEFKFLLEGKGILSAIRLKREMNLQSKGKILTLDEIQEEFLRTLAKIENIEKKIVHIEGKVGSGKTLLEVEALKIKLFHYFLKYQLDCENMTKKLRVIILVDDLGWSKCSKKSIVFRTAR